MADTASKTATGESTTTITANEGRGRPYYEKLRRNLKQTLEKKRELDKKVATIESTIAKEESAYLEETSAAGNIIKGFDNYMKASASATAASTGTGTATRRKGGISDADRIFSRSSISWINRDNPPTISLVNNGASSTPSEAATPTVAGSGRTTPAASTKAGALKNKKKGGTSEKAKDGEEDVRPQKRSKVSWGRD